MLTGCDDVTSLGVNFCETKWRIWSGFSNRSEISQGEMKASRLVYFERENLASVRASVGISMCYLFKLQVKNPQVIYMKAHGNRIIILLFKCKQNTLWPARKNPWSSKVLLHRESSTWGTNVLMEISTWCCDSAPGLTAIMQLSCWS